MWSSFRRFKISGRFAGELRRCSSALGETGDSMTKASTFAKKSFRFRSNFKFETTQNRTHTIARFAPVYSVSVQTLKRLFTEKFSVNTDAGGTRSGGLQMAIAICVFRKTSKMPSFGRTIVQLPLIVCFLLTGGHSKSWKMEKS